MPKFHIKESFTISPEEAETSMFLAEGAVYIGDDHIEVKSQEAVALLAIHRDKMQPADPVAEKLTATYDAQAKAEG